MKYITKYLKRYWLELALFFLLLALTINYNPPVRFPDTGPKPTPNLQSEAPISGMFFSPMSGDLKIGDLVTISVLLDSTVIPINAMEGEIIFSTDKLEMESISTVGSINTLWIPVSPYLSTTTNRIIFSGGMLNPGFLGIGGDIITLVFRAKASGTASLKFINASMLADDGLGTSLTIQNQPASFTIVSSTIKP